METKSSQILTLINHYRGLASIASAKYSGNVIDAMQRILDTDGGQAARQFAQAPRRRRRSDVSGTQGQRELTDRIRGLIGSCDSPQVLQGGQLPQSFAADSRVKFFHRNRSARTHNSFGTIIYRPLSSRSVTVQAPDKHRRFSKHRKAAIYQLVPPNDGLWQVRLQPHRRRQPRQHRACPPLRRDRWLAPHFHRLSAGGTPHWPNRRFGQRHHSPRPQ